MQINDLLNERVLTGEFKFGFELEAIINGPFRDEDDAYEAVNSFIDRYFPDSAGVDEDSSLDSESDIDVAFEWPSPVLELTPQNIQKSIEFLSALNDGEIYTNDSCGFHVHVSFPHISPASSGWLLLALSLDPVMRDKISRFRKYSFFQKTYASDEFLDEIAKYYNEAKNSNEWDNFWNKFRTIISDEKYRSIRVHPQGTIEWRGPRGFLEEKNQQVIKEFFMLLVMFVRWISTTLDAKQIDQISRAEYDSRLKSGSVDARFTKHLEGGKWSVDQKKEILPEVFRIAPWLRKATFSGAHINIKNGKLVWYNGFWENGTWEDGTWISGYWANGTWKNGTWKSGTWANGKWMDGIWEDGYWQNGEWFDGEWEYGKWMNGKWHSGRWYTGKIKNVSSQSPPQ